MPFKRLLSTLPPISSAPVPSSLLPPYSHALKPRVSLRPPYSYVAQGSGSLNPPYRFQLVPQADPASHRHTDTNPHEWIKSLPPARVQELWLETLASLKRETQVPEIRLHQLSSESTVEAVKATGVVVVRDVIPDGEAIQYAREIMEEMQASGGMPIYWKRHLLRARAHPSVLSANTQVLSALLGAQEEGYVRADAVQEGIGASEPSLPAEEPWRIAHESAAPYTPLQAHLTLTPSPSPSS
ncbi:hypothetical protein P7C73_g6110, partial [Tremellales sp. Uapishka_1]